MHFLVFANLLTPYCIGVTQEHKSACPNACAIDDNTPLGLAWPMKSKHMVPCKRSTIVWDPLLAQVSSQDSLSTVESMSAVAVKGKGRANSGTILAQELQHAV